MRASAWTTSDGNPTDGTVTGVTAAAIDRQVRLPPCRLRQLRFNGWKEIPEDLNSPDLRVTCMAANRRSFRHRNRAKKSNNKQDIIEALRSIDPEAANAEASRSVNRSEGCAKAQPK